jgi:hypothetical protein
MTEPSPARPVPGPPRPGPAPADGSSPAAQPSSTGEPTRSEAASFVELEQRPVAEHVGVFEAEHARLQRELGTIDQL